MMTAKNPGPLLVVATHPTQFLSPWMQYLSGRLKATAQDVAVWYATLPDPQLQGVGFGKAFTWDVDLLSGYSWEHLGNRSSEPSLSGFFGTRVGGLRRRLRKLAPSAVLVTGWHQYSMLQIALACRMLDIPVLVRAEASAFKPRRRLNRLLHRALMRLFDGYLTIGESNRRYYLESGVAASRLYASPYFVDNQRLRESTNDHQQLRRRWRQKHELSEAQCVLLFAGKLQSKKRPGDLLRAAQLLADRGITGFTVVFAGDGELRDQLQADSQGAGFPVRFTGFVNQSELPGLYSGADCLVLPSNHDETWGLVVNEAMNFSLPAVVSDQVGCGPDLVIEDQTGYRHRYADEASLAAVLQPLIADTDRRKRLGRAGFERVSQYSIEAASDGLLSAWQAVLERSGR